MKTDLKIELPLGISQEMIDQAQTKWKPQHVKFAVLPKDDDGNEFLTVLVRKPCRSVLSEYQKWSDKNPGKAEEILVNSCLLSHKDEVKADDGLFAGAVDAIAQLISVRKATIKNI